MTPTFLVIGAAKAGTTSVHHYLEQHPEVFVARKSLNYFIDHPARRTLFQGPDVTYKPGCTSQDEYQAAFDAAPVGAVCGDVSHIYQYAPEAPARIRAALGAPRLVSFLRDPVDRAYAQYAFHRQLGTEVIDTFEGALEAEDARVRAGWDPVFHYRRRGRYGAQLAHYFEVFPPDCLRVFQFEDFFRRPAEGMAAVFTFLGVDPGLVPDTSRKWVPAGDPRNPQDLETSSEGPPPAKPVAPGTRRLLLAQFEEDIRLTEELTGLDLSEWREEGRHDGADPTP